MYPESTDQYNSSDDNALSPGRVYRVDTHNMQALFEHLMGPGVHGSHVVSAFQEGQEPVASIIVQLDASEAQAVKQHQGASSGGHGRAAKIAEIHAQWQRDAEKLWAEGIHSLNNIAVILARKYHKAHQDASPEDEEVTEKYDRSPHTIRKYIHAPH